MHRKMLQKNLHSLQMYTATLPKKVSEKDVDLNVGNEMCL